MTNLETKAVVFRHDINGLRALAVISVVFFHFGVSFPGGFVGVDVFFVISGYLMTQILVAKPNIGNFYLSRARKILPPLLIMILTVLLVGGALLLPEQLAELGRDAGSAASFALNFHFASTTGYFDPKAAHSWLLHCWSLAIEIQFYLFFPLYLNLARAFKISIGKALVALVLISFTFAAIEGSSRIGFYWPHTRFWEFGVGGLVALQPRTRSKLLSYLGVFIVCGSMLRLYPGYGGPWLIAPVCGAALILKSGERIALLDNTLFQFLGKISYSIYLWHWPILLLCQYLNFVSSFDLAVAMIFVVLLSGVSYLLFERPAKQSHAIAIVSLAAACLAVVVLPNVLSDGAKWRIPRGIASMIDVDKSPVESWRFRKCFLATEQAISLLAPECAFAIEGQPSLMLWGDSTLAHFVPGIAASSLNVDFKITQITGSSCSAWEKSADRELPNCEGTREFARHFVQTSKPEILLLSTSVNGYGPAPPGIMAEIAERQGLEMAKLIKQALEAGVGNVIVIGPIPVWDVPLPEVYYRNQYRLGGITSRIVPQYLENMKEWEATNRSVAEKAGAKFISLYEKLCDVSGCMVTTTDTSGNPTLIQFDTLHLTNDGSRWIVNAIIAPFIESLISANKLSGVQSSQAN